MAPYLCDTLSIRFLFLCLDIDVYSVVSNDDATTVSSSVKSDNLKEIWQLLDENEKESLLKSNEYESNDAKNPFGNAFKVTGIKSPGKPSVKFAKKDNSPSTNSKTPKTPRSNVTNMPSTSAPNSARNYNEKPKIRNYNIKN